MRNARPSSRSRKSFRRSSMRSIESSRQSMPMSQRNPGRRQDRQVPAASELRQARRGSKREELLNVIRQGNGLTRGEILEKMGLKGDKSGEMSVSNALTALTKSNQVRRNEERKYVAG